MSVITQIRSIIHKPGATPPPETGPVDRRRRKRFNHKGRRILAIDDSPTILATLNKTLRSAGCIVLEAAEAEEGLERIRQEEPDLVFLDIVLPGMNGFAALRQMRRDPAIRNIPVIMISGNEQATEQYYAKRIGADDFMRKPFSRHEVFARIETLVEVGKLTRLGEGTSANSDAVAPEVPKTGLAAPERFPRTTANSAKLSDDLLRCMTAKEARAQLNAMGLQYFNQKEFVAAVKRSDKLAVDLFIIGGGVDLTV